MFKLAATPTFWVPVKVDFAKEDGSRGVVAFDVQSKRIPRGELQSKLQALAGVDGADLLFLQDVLTDWRKVPDDDGSPVPFSPEALQQLYDLGFAGPTVSAVIAAAPQAKLKN